MKKQASKTAEPIKGLVEQAVEQIKDSAEAAQNEQTKRRRMVEFHILKSVLEFATEKAQLIAFTSPEGEDKKFWISKSQSSFSDDSNDPERMLLRIPAWLYYKSGLNNYFSVEKWSSVKI